MSYSTGSDLIYRMMESSRCHCIDTDQHCTVRCYCSRCTSGHRNSCSCWWMTEHVDSSLVDCKSDSVRWMDWNGCRSFECIPGNNWKEIADAGVLVRLPTVLSSFLCLSAVVCTRVEVERQSLVSYDSGHCRDGLFLLHYQQWVQLMVSDR